MSSPAIAQTLMLAFEGTTAPADIIDRVKDNPPAGFTIFSYDNSVSVDQMTQLTKELEAANPDELPLLIASDQEGGQLIALVGSTDFPGNMALGAAGDADLTERIGRAMGTEMVAMGLNLNYAPIADLNTNPANPSLGIRAFGDDPATTAQHVAAFVRGSRSAGVLTSLKHFPGKGGALVDSHFGLPVIRHDRARLDSFELVPFSAGIEAGADLVMTGHFAIPGITERDDIASTLSRAVLTDMLRGDLGFEGAVITDAFDMGAIAQGAGQVIDAIAAINAGVDLMLMTAPTQDRVEQGLALASHRGLITDQRLAQAVGKSRELRRWVAGFDRPSKDVVGSAEHQQLAGEVAQRSITLLEAEPGLLPLRLDAGQRIAAIMPEPKDLTPADTSAQVLPGLATAIRQHHANTDEYVVGHPPTAADISSVVAQAGDSDLIVLGTLSASMDQDQAALAKALVATGVPIINIAMRTPYDVLAVGGASAYICSYGLRQPSMDATAAALFGAAPFTGKLPVTVSEQYPRGHGLEMNL